MGQICFEILFQGTQLFHLALFKRTSNGQFLPFYSKSEKMRDYAALALGLFLATQPWKWHWRRSLNWKHSCAWVSFSRTLAPPWSAWEFWAQPEGTMDILNSWSENSELSRRNPKRSRMPQPVQGAVIQYPVLELIINNLNSNCSLFCKRWNSDI